MREIRDHIVEGDSVNHQVQIHVMDEPGPGGAHHEYAINWDGATPAQDLIEIRELVISFQNGPIKDVGVNGVTNEALLAIVIDRLRCFQAGPFACVENHQALACAVAALGALQVRTIRRIERGVEGTHTP